ncbi:hypothetical protein ACIQC5_23905 [Paenarthrobacter sp. NPDC092416]|uniref:hypothetical protein n=1 Tax=Paenarthrobacter sp. NPDC092416 TaxID=3364386 RepID=UPI0038122338
MTEPNNLRAAGAKAEGLDVQWPEPAGETGDALVDRALGLLDGVQDAPVSGHGDVYSDIHDSLLEALDAEPGLPPAARPEGDS